MAKKRGPMMDQLRAVALATRFLASIVPDLDFRDVRARLDDGQWWVEFDRVTPPDVVESPSAWCITVNAKTGKAKGFMTL